MFAYTWVAVLPFLVHGVTAICGGYTYGIGNQIGLGNGISRWDVYDGSCNVVDSLTTNENPCTQGIFECSPSPIYFDGYVNTFSGRHYTCDRDPHSESCGSNSISVCCY